MGRLKDIPAHFLGPQFKQRPKGDFNRCPSINNQWLKFCVKEVIFEEGRGWYRAHDQKCNEFGDKWLRKKRRKR